MPRKGRRNAKSSGYVQVEFLRIHLDGDDKLWLDENDLNARFPTQLIFDLVEVGYKVSFTQDQNHQRYICSLVDKGRDSATQNCCISGSGATVLDAWHSLAYRHLVKLESDWSTLDRDGASDTSQHS